MSVLTKMLCELCVVSFSEPVSVFKLESETFEAMKTLRPLLEKISVERTFVEFDKLLLAPFGRVGLSFP